VIHLIFSRSVTICAEHLLACSGLLESLVIPFQEQIDDWKKTAVHLDKDHAHGRLTSCVCVCVCVCIGTNAVCVNWAVSVVYILVRWPHSASRLHTIQQCTWVRNQWAGVVASFFNGDWSDCSSEDLIGKLIIKSEAFTIIFLCWFCCVSIAAAPVTSIPSLVGGTSTALIDPSRMGSCRSRNFLVQRKVANILTTWFPRWSCIQGWPWNGLEF